MLTKYKDSSSPEFKKMPIARKLASSLAVAALLFSSVNPAAFAAEITNVQTVASFKDVNGHWAQSPIGKWASSGIINGYTEGTFKPTGSITRAEVIKIIDGMAKGYYNAAGTYGATTIAGSALIAASGATLSGSKVSGDLYLTAGIGNGEATLDQVTVSGTTFVSGGGIIESPFVIG